MMPGRKISRTDVYACKRRCTVGQGKSSKAAQLQFGLRIAFKCKTVLLAMSAPRVLCVVKGPYHVAVETRCSILKNAGYDARAAWLEEAQALLRGQTFDLVILSAILSDEEIGLITTAAGRKTQIMILSGFVWPSALLAEVAERLRRSRENPP